MCLLGLRSYDVMEPSLSQFNNSSTPAKKMSAAQLL